MYCPPSEMLNAFGNIRVMDFVPFVVFVRHKYVDCTIKPFSQIGECEEQPVWFQRSISEY